MAIIKVLVDKIMVVKYIAIITEEREREREREREKEKKTYLPPLALTKLILQLSRSLTTL